MRTDSGARNGKARERGWALASVLWGVTMLSLMAAATQELALTSHRTERRAWDRARADAALEAAVTQAILGITAPSLDVRWSVDGASREIVASGLRVTVAVQSESGRYDLNAVDPVVLKTLLRASEVDPDNAASLTDSIVGWRSLGGLHQLKGATDDDYARAHLPYRPRHGPFQSVTELRLVFGMTPELFRRIAPALTVYTRRAIIDQALAPREALLALYGGNREQVDAVLEAREAGDDADLANHLSARPGVISPGVSLVGQAFDIEAKTSIGGRVYRRGVVLALTGNDHMPIVRLAWQER